MSKTLNTVLFRVTTLFPFLIARKLVQENINGINYELGLIENIDRHLYYFGHWRTYFSNNTVVKQWE
jgi:hypothetical protein